MPWIATKKKIPKKDTWVLGFWNEWEGKQPVVKVCRWSAHFDCWLGEHDLGLSKPIAWHRLPLIPKGVFDEK